MTKGTLEQRQALLGYFGDQNIQADEKVRQVKSLFEATGATQAIQESIKEYTERAFAQLDQADLSDQAKAYLSDFGKALMNRNF
jgi:geranylgeranyl diphosphate synthase type II